MKNNNDKQLTIPLDCNQKPISPGDLIYEQNLFDSRIYRIGIILSIIPSSLPPLEGQKEKFVVKTFWSPYKKNKSAFISSDYNFYLEKVK